MTVSYHYFFVFFVFATGLIPVNKDYLKCFSGDCALFGDDNLPPSLHCPPLQSGGVSATCRTVLQAELTYIRK